MVLWHFAYTFDAEKYHRKLGTAIIRDGKLDLVRLQQMAYFVVDNATEELKRKLSNLKYDAEWLDDPDKDASQASLWYTINLASAFNPCSSLSDNRFRYSSLILEGILPQLGWENEELHQLIHGRQSLDSLLLGSEYEIIADELNLYGGCLSIVEIRTLLSHLESNAVHFSFPSLNLQRVTEEYSEHYKLQPHEILMMAYKDAVDMLETAITRNEALYLLRDF